MGMVCLLFLTPMVELLDLQSFRAETSRGIRTTNIDQEPNNNLQNANEVTWSTSIRINGSLSETDSVDWYKFYLTKGDANANDPDHIAISLTDNNTGTGVLMELFGPNTKPPYPHKLAVSEVNNAQNPDPNASASIIEIVPPLDGYFFLRILPNGVPNGNYILVFYKTSETSNPGYDANNDFSSATLVDPLNETYITSEYLDPKWDIHDFYKFTGYKNQTFEVKLGLPDTADYKLFLFDNQSTKYIASSSSVGFGLDDSIKLTLKKTQTYYVRVWATVNGSVNHKNNYGWYSIEFKGNLPPLWNQSAKDIYELEEDAEPLYINPELLWEDLNKNDDISYFVWDTSLNNWAVKDEQNLIVSEVMYDNFKLQLINNGTIPYPEYVIKIIPLDNRFGVTQVKIGVMDSPPETYNEHNITIKIIGINDYPVVNDTIYWNRFMPDGLVIKHNKIIATDESSIKIQVTTYDIEGDDLIFSDNTDMFDIDPTSGTISFYATYKQIGTHNVNITVTDDGVNPNQLSSTRTVQFEIQNCCFNRRPITFLKVPENNSIIKSLKPTLVWNSSDIDTMDDYITYNVYFSDSLDKILSLDKSALILNGTNRTSYTITTSLLDKQTYYWTVIPFDGFFLGFCDNGYHQFKVDTEIITPAVVLLTPKNQSILNYTDVKLSWGIQYEGDQKVVSDIYLGITDTDLVLMEQGYEGTSYFPEGIFNGHVYYWKIVPKAGVPPNRISGDESQIFNFEIKRGYEPPNVNLISPDDRSIFKTTEVSLSWEVDYDDPQKVRYEVYMDTTSDFGVVSYQLTTDTFLKLEDLAATTYYWRIIPLVGEVPGTPSEIRWFKIDPTVVQPIVIPKYPKANSTINITWINLQWTLDYAGPIPKVRFDVYIDNSTDYRPGMRQIINNYRQFFIGVKLDDNKTYYWYIIPSIETEDGFVVGEFRGYLAKFTANTKSLPNPDPKFELSVDRDRIYTIPGNISKINITLRNTGNIPLQIEILYEFKPLDVLFVNTPYKLINIPQGSLESFTIDIIIPTKIYESEIELIITASAVETNLVEQEKIEIKIDHIIPPSPENENDEKDASNYYIWIYIVILIVIFLISLFLFSKLKRHRLLEHQRREMIVNYVKENPGEHFRAIQKALQLEVGVVAHHINKLEREEFIKSRQDGQYRRFYPMDAKIDVKLILSQVQENILNWIKRNPGIAGSTIATQIGVDRKVVTYHINVLQNAGFIYTEKMGREKVCYSAVGA